VAYGGKHHHGLVVELARFHSAGVVVLPYIHGCSELIMNFISRYLLPRNVDFNAALLAQVEICESMIHDLYKACMENNISLLDTVSDSAGRERALKEDNMALLLNVFIAPYDKESIYRMITQLDWVALSAKHFRLETQVYQLHSLSEYEEILAMLSKMVTELKDGFLKLSDKRLEALAVNSSGIHDRYDEIVKLCAEATGRLMTQDDIKHIIRHKDMLLQLKEIAKRIHIAANTLEDMAIKVA
jgi:uncharacterized protein Yka (UPF0111/DUF47 family)